MKRKLILLAVTIVFLAGFGVLLHSPPSMIDAVTGVTPKAKKAAQAAAQLEGSYVLGINMMSDGLDNENTRNKLKERRKFMPAIRNLWIQSMWSTQPVKKLVQRFM